MCMNLCIILCVVYCIDAFRWERMVSPHFHPSIRARDDPDRLWKYETYNIPHLNTCRAVKQSTHYQACFGGRQNWLVWSFWFPPSVKVDSLNTTEALQFASSDGNFSVGSGAIFALSSTVVPLTGCRFSVRALDASGNTKVMEVNLLREPSAAPSRLVGYVLFVILINSKHCIAEFNWQVDV